MSTSLDAATRLKETGPDEYWVSLNEAWWLERTAFGGYLAAIMLRAMTVRKTQPHQRVLSLTVQFNASTTIGEGAIRVSRHYASPSITTKAATLMQGGTTVVSALAAFGRARHGPALNERPRPPVPDAENCAPMVARPPVRARFPMSERFERRRVPSDWVGGWIRFAEHRRLDELGVVTLLDSWTAAAAAKTAARRMLTVAYFVQFLRPTPVSPPDRFSLVMFQCASADGGYAEDEGELWHEGLLVARSQQVVLIGSEDTPRR